MGINSHVTGWVIPYCLYGYPMQVYYCCTHNINVASRGLTECIAAALSLLIQKKGAPVSNAAVSSFVLMGELPTWRPSRAVCHFALVTYNLTTYIHQLFVPSYHHMHDRKAWAGNVTTPWQSARGNTCLPSLSVEKRCHEPEQDCTHDLTQSTCVCMLCPIW